MTFYKKKTEYSLLGYEKATRKGKMYSAILGHKKTNKIIKIPFGSSEYGNYQDKTNLNLYPHLIHGNNERRRLYRARARGQVKEGYYSPSFFSLTQLW